MGDKGCLAGSGFGPPAPAAGSGSAASSTATVEVSELAHLAECAAMMEEDCAIDGGFVIEDSDPDSIVEATPVAVAVAGRRKRRDRETDGSSTCAGLQYPLQYLYHYRAKVSAGIPEINRHQSAKSSIRANLRVYVTSATTVAFKLEDVEYSDCHVCRECTSDHEYIAAFEEPASLLGRHAFGINERGHFVHHAGEKAWVLNFYKSIVGLFNIYPLRNTFFGTHNGTRAGAYNDFEQTVMGTCKTTYTEHKLSGVALAQYSQFVREHITGDRQLNNTCAAPLVAKLPPGRKARSVSGRKTSTTSGTSPLTRCDLPRITRTVTRVVRSVNLEECVDRVEHQVKELAF
ncbi:hemolymph clottable protein-like [Hyalella azteca]|uniref:Hemolymph clottable protein-like n=1 Tax=Hyalella azteca TaxID=294128 RepID=A0A8B7PM14_HYAAZ|nr:hemolymph clottable protein-like [Hyalella azteca]